MTYIVHFYTSTHEPITVGYANTLEAAKELLGDGVFKIEEDEDYPNVFSGVTNHGKVFTIHPEN